MVQNRIQYIDLGAGIMILWMIISHAVHASWNVSLYSASCLEDISVLNDFHAYIDETGEVRLNPIIDILPFLYFFMPWFFYKSGKFFKKQDVLNLLKKDADKFLYQFVIWSAIGFVFYLIFCYLNDTLSFRSIVYRPLKQLFFEGSVEINNPLWFLLTIFGVRQIANVILPNKEERLFKAKCLCVILVGVLAAFLLHLYNNHYIPQWVANGSAGLAFFTMGYAFCGYETKWWILLPCIGIYIAECIWGFSYIDMRKNYLYSGYYLLNIVESYAGIVVFNNLCRFISTHTHAKFFQLVGRNAMIIYVSHGVLYAGIPNMINNSMVPYTLWIIIGSYIVFLPTMCYVKNRIDKSDRI